MELDETPVVKPVTGLDSMSIDETPGTIVLTSQKATLLLVAAAILMILAFVAGFLIRSNT